MAERAGKRASPTPALLLNGIPVQPGKATADVFASTFAAIYRVDDGRKPDVPPPRPGVSFNRFSFNELSVRDALVRLQPKLSAGPSGLPPYLFSKLTPALVRPLTLLFDITTASLSPPNQFLDSIVRPIFKRKGSRSSPTNYRAVGNVDPGAKIFESVISRQLASNVETNNLFHHSQHGFRKCRSRETNILCRIDYASRQIDIGNTVASVFTDFKSAFDVFSHEKLFLRLQSLGIGGPALALLRNFLPCRASSVRIGPHTSDSFPLLSGGIQGSSLSPWLYLAYTDLLLREISATGVQCFAYADDLVLLGTSADNFASLKRALAVLERFNEEFGMSLCPSKCSVLTQGPGPAPTLHLGGVPLPAVPPEGHKDLGFTVCPSTDFDRHIALLVSKARSKLSFIFRTIRTKNKEALIFAFKTYVRSILESGSVVIGGASKSSILAIEKVQRRFTYLLYRRCEMRNRHHVTRAEKLDLSSISSRMLVSDLCFIHGCHTGRLKCPPVNTRAAEGPVGRYPQSRPHRITPDRDPSAFRLSFLPNRAADAWNSLSCHTVQLKSTAFREHCENVFLSYRYD